MKTILVLTDFSNRADYVADFAVNMAVRDGSNLVFCHVMEAHSGQVTDNQVSNEKPESRSDLKKFKDKFKKKVKISGKLSEFKPAIDCIIERGNFAEAVEKIVDEKLVDLVVIGSKKTNYVSRFQFGSQTYILPDMIKCPVLLIPEGLKFQGINTIVYATDLPVNNQKALRFLAQLAQPFNATIKVNHITKTSFAGKLSEFTIAKSLNDQLGTDYPPVFYNTLKEDSLTAGLLEMIGRDKINILALVHRKYQFLEGLFHESLSKLMPDRSSIPLLILPNSLISDIPHGTFEKTAMLRV